MRPALGRSRDEGLDSNATFAAKAADGDLVDAGTVLASIEGAARGIFGAERTMLNFLIHLSGVATQSRRFAQPVECTGALVVDTRKTIPGSPGLGEARRGLWRMRKSSLWPF